MHLVFGGERCRLSAFSFVLTVLSDLWRCAIAFSGCLCVAQMTMSSAYVAICVGVGVSLICELIAMVKRIGIKTVPCIRPVVGYCVCDVCVWCRT